MARLWLVAPVVCSPKKPFVLSPKPRAWSGVEFWCLRDYINLVDVVRFASVPTYDSVCSRTSASLIGILIEPHRLLKTPHAVAWGIASASIKMRSDKLISIGHVNSVGTGSNRKTQSI